MKEILTYTRAAINTSTDLDLFTAGVSGVLFTAVAAAGLTLKVKPARGGVLLLPSNPVGAGLGFGDTLAVTGVGDILLTMWGELELTYRINGTALEVLVATPINFTQTGSAAGTTITANKPIVIKPGLYVDRAYRLVSATDRSVTW